MEWVVGIVGFIVGFGAGQMLLLKLLKDRSRQELLHDKQLHWTYGLLNWGVAVGMCLLALWMYRYYTGLI